MRNYVICFMSLSITILVIAACGSSKHNIAYQYKPDDQKLYDTIVYEDSIFFEAYNTCNINLEKYASFFSDSLEFYHDKGGLMTSKKDVVDATKRNVCGKVTRVLVKGSIEVYPIKDYGAIEMGVHRFHNNTEKEGRPSRPGKFVIFWQRLKDEWKIAKVISLH